MVRLNYISMNTTSNSLLLGSLFLQLDRRCGRFFLIARPAYGNVLRRHVHFHYSVLFLDLFGTGVGFSDAGV